MEQTADACFTVDAPIWRTVDGWAKTHGYSLVKWLRFSRLYEKSHPILRGYGRWQVEIEEHGDDVAVSGGVDFRRLSPPGPGREAFLQRARGEVNELLESLGQAPPAL